LKLKKYSFDYTISGNVTYPNGTVNETLNSTYLTLQCIDEGNLSYEASTYGANTSYVINQTGANASYDFEVFPGTYTLTVENDGYIVQIKTVSVSNTSMTVDFELDEGELEFIIYGYAEDESTWDPVEGLSIKVYDTITHREIITSFNDTDDYFELELYPSTFDIILDAEGYSPYVQNGITLNVSNPSLEIFPQFDKDVEEIISIELTVQGDDFSTLQVVKDWQLNSDSLVPGIDDGPGNLKMKIDSDERFGNDDGTLSDAEILVFKSWFEKTGPEYLYSDDFFKVNDTAFDPDIITGQTFNYTVTLYNFNNSVDNISGMRIKTSMIYETEKLDNPDQLAYKVWLGNLEEDYDVIFGPSYEIVTVEDDNWNLALDDNDEAIPNQAVIKNATTLEVFAKKAPVANITVTINEKTYYSDDEIFAGSATDDTVVKDDYENITFDATGSTDKVGEIINYTWNFGDGNSAYGELVTHNYTLAKGSTKTYEVSLTLLDSAGAVNGIKDSKVQIVVDAKAPILPSSELLIETAMGERNQSGIIDLNATSASDDEAGSGIPDSAGSYLWEFDNGVESFGKTIEHVFRDAGDTTVNLTVKDKVGNKNKASFEINIRDTEGPIVTIVADIKAEVSEDIFLNANTTSDNMDELNHLKFDWDFNDTAVNAESERTGVNLTIKYGKPGTYVITLNVSDNSNNSVIAIHTITITAPDLIVSKLDLSDLEPRAGEAVDITATIRNEGGSGAKNFTVSLLIDDVEVAGQSEKVQFLLAGAEWVVNFTWEAEAGVHDIKISVDYNDVSKQVQVDVTDENSYQALIIVILLIVIAIVVFVVLKKRRGL
jgi:PKD repeat protein